MFLIQPLGCNIINKVEFNKTVHTAKNHCLMLITQWQTNWEQYWQMHSTR